MTEVTNQSRTNEYYTYDTDNTVNLQQVKSYLRILDDVCDDELLLLLDSAVSYIQNHTGLDDFEIRTREDIRIALLVLVSDFYWNRDLQTSNKYSNKLVESIIENNRINFVG